MFLNLGVNLYIYRKWISQFTIPDWYDMLQNGFLQGGYHYEVRKGDDATLQLGADGSDGTGLQPVRPQVGLVQWYVDHLRADGQNGRARCGRPGGGDHPAGTQRGLARCSGATPRHPASARPPRVHRKEERDEHPDRVPELGRRFSSGLE